MRIKIKNEEGRDCTKRLLVCLSLFMALIFLPQKIFSVTIILTSDEQLDMLLNPDTKIDLSTGLVKRYASLRQICEDAQKRGDKVLTIAFDEFFRQYRDHPGTQRSLTPDMDEYIEKIKIISDFAAKYDMGIGLSLLTPLELGNSFIKETGQSGKWLHYKVGICNPETGEFNVQLWKQLYWTNNKGKFPIKVKGVKAFAFKDKKLSSSPYKAVNYNDIKEVTDNIKIKEYNITTLNSFPTQRITIYSDGNTQAMGYDKIFILIEYETPEMDYFSPQALPFLKNLLKKYHEKGINLVSLYSDEMHIQQDWNYFNHNDDGQFAVRYYTPSMGKIYNDKYKEPLDEKSFIYFSYGMNTLTNSATAPVNIQYVFDDTPEGIHHTFLMRHRYYKLLNDYVVELFVEAKKYAEELFGHELATNAHASWAESPTIDLWNTEKLHHPAYQYEYTPNFIWSNTVHQASAACYDYFKWGEYLQPTGNDFAECGWLDRNYYGAAMAASIGVINKYPKAYAAYWGMPLPVQKRKEAINSAFGAGSMRSIDLMTEGVHRDVDVIMLYPTNLVAVEERFGSWITQYAYANYITADKLLELGKITSDGKICIKNKIYTTLVALFEPLPNEKLLDFMKNFASSGGKIIWFGPPPLLNEKAQNCSSEWSELFNIYYDFSIYQGEIAAGKIVTFKNEFTHIAPQSILTDFIVDRIYPITLLNDAHPAAEVDEKIIGGASKYGKGTTCYFGFRPRDDQSASLGYESRTLFEILNAVGAYPPTGNFKFNDNTEFVSRNSEYLTTRFPNGTTIIVRHYRTHRENWPGGFSRDDEIDSNFLKINPLPSSKISLKNFKVNGNNIDYEGDLLVAFRTTNRNELIAFDGSQCKEIVINGKQFIFSEKPFKRIIFVPENKSETNYALYIEGLGKIRIPIPPSMKNLDIKLFSSYNKEIKFQKDGKYLVIEISPEISGKWMRIENIY